MRMSVVTQPAHAPMRLAVFITTEPSLNQRQLAERLSISLGKTNYLLKALLEKGLIKANNFRRNRWLTQSSVPRPRYFVPDRLQWPHVYCQTYAPV